MLLRISARSSHLARLQAKLVAEALLALNAKQTLEDPLQIEFNFRESLGDKNLQDPLWKLPQKGVFTEDFYQDLVTGATDMVVHSWKDLPLEEKPETEIAASLEREDQRDLLLVKKTSLEAGLLNKNNIRIFTSSPRREYNLRPFLLEALPWAQQENLTSKQIEFISVRGNVPTRLQKLFLDSNIDGLVLAKAAVDRFLSSQDPELAQVQQDLRRQLELCQWMVLPLSENPNAAAQGALAIEIRKDRHDLKKLLALIHNQYSAEAATIEREILGRYGGGCHQKIGIAVLLRPYGQIRLLRGLTDSGQVLQERRLIPAHPQRSFNKKWSSSVMKDIYVREQVECQISPEVDVVYVSRVPAWKKFSGLVWTAGPETWKKLAALGVWVHGCAEGLGEQEDSRIEFIAGKKNLRWCKLTNDLAVEERAGTSRMPVLATYKMKLSDQYKDQIQRQWGSEIQNAECFFWTTPSHFELITRLYPEVKQRHHASGPGLTARFLRDQIGREPLIYLSEKEFYEESISK